MSDSYELGDVVPLSFTVMEDGEPVDPTSWTLTIATPSGDVDKTADTEHPSVGQFELLYTPLAAGPHAAIFQATGDHAGLATNVFLVTASSSSLVNISETQLRDYLGETDETGASLLAALAAERSAQAAICRIDPYNADLREALFRRVARNFAARSVPVATFSTFEGGAVSKRVPASDPEIKRLEAPYRRMPCG